MAGFQRLQRRLLLATLVATALAVPLCLWLFDLGTAASLLVGALAGLLYLRLLARSVSRLGVASKSLSKAQLLVPIALVLAAAKIPALQMLPALIGFLLYKPALIAQALLDA
jgi:ATP synthase protein I